MSKASPSPENKERKMRTFEIREVQKMSAILTVFSKLDDIRWNEASNYNLINYCSNDLTADEKLLIHWLCYITDRQMPFKRIWDIGGYVISHLVRTYTANPNNEVWGEVISPYVRRNGNTVRLESPLEGLNARLGRYGITGDTVPFASRYMPEDLALIYRTLGILDKVAQRSMARFMCLALDEEMNLEQEIKQLALALNQLTYTAGGAVSGAQFDQQIEKVGREISDFELDTDADGALFGRKRLWCSIRDYLKSPEFNRVFVTSLDEASCSNPNRWARDSVELKAALNVLELPGDVWNNAEIFREGLFRPYIANERKTWDMPRTVREIYNCIKQTETKCFYPEQLDVTFDFIPRMCESSMCAVCLFGAGIKEVCHQKKDLLCPVVLYSCGYTHRCNPSECSFKEDSTKGFCKSSCVRSE
jgi:hypothetical protein